jgi:hypothetical protein
MLRVEADMASDNSSASTDQYSLLPSTGKSRIFFREILPKTAFRNVEMDAIVPEGARKIVYCNVSYKREIFVYLFIAFLQSTQDT